MNFGRYQITKEVGRGSMGVVYEARDPQIDRVVAVKVLRQDRMGSETFVNRFLKEAKVIGRLSHPNIVAIYDAGEEQGNVYIAMESLTGTSLADIVLGNPQNADDVVAFGVQIAEALDYAHQKGVVHRDIKPSNIVVQPDGRIKITDFGIAHIDDSSATMQTQAGEILGTPSYMSPEQVLGKPVDGRSDLFSLGAILYELCTGKRAFGGRDKNLATIFNEIIQVTPEEPSVAEGLIPKRLSGIIMQALQKDPQNRFQTGKELAEALKGALTESPPLVAGIPDSVKKKRSIVPLLAAMGIVILVIAILYSFQNKNHSSQHITQKSETMPSESKQLTPLPPQKRMSAAGVPMEQPRTKQTLEAEQQKQPPQPAQQLPATELVTLKLRTTPQGAHVYLDGNSTGTTPLTLHLPKGTHVLRMTRTGYRDMEKQITIEDTMEYPLTFNLKKVAKPD